LPLWQRQQGSCDAPSVAHQQIVGSARCARVHDIHGNPGVPETLPKRGRQELHPVTGANQQHFNLSYENRRQ
jgi:hypothetical protein